MTYLVTGSSGHLGEALVRTLRSQGDAVAGLDARPSEWTTHVGSILDGALVRRAMRGVRVVLHTATLHKPHVATHNRQAFVDTNVSGTLKLLEEAVAAGVESFVFTSTTSVFGAALSSAPDAPAVWVTEALPPVPKNIYGVTKAAAEDLCELFHWREGLACIVLRTSRFFPEEDDEIEKRQAFAADNLKVNEFLFRRVEIFDAVSAHMLAAQRAGAIGFGKYIVGATSPFSRGDLSTLRRDAPSVVRGLYSESDRIYTSRGWKMPQCIDRVYVNERARRELGWHPVFDFGHILSRLSAGEDFRSVLARHVGSKGYHAGAIAEDPHPVA